MKKYLILLMIFCNCSLGWMHQSKEDGIIVFKSGDSLLVKDAVIDITTDQVLIYKNDKEIIIDKDSIAVLSLNNSKWK